MEKKSNCNKFLTLLENDFCRNLKFVLPIIGGFWILHLIVSWGIVSSLSNKIGDWLSNNTIEEVLEAGKQVNFYDVLRFGQLVSIMYVSILAVTLYTIFLWEKEWFGSTKSIYTLLSIPVKRSYIVMSKILTMIIFIAFNILIQISTLFIDNAFMKLRLDEKLVVDKSVLFAFSTSSRSNKLNLASIDAVNLALILITAVLLLSLIVLLFRSFKVKGLILGGVLFILYFVIYVYSRQVLNLYINEWFIFKLIFSLITSILTFNYCKYLLKNKVAV